MKTGQFSLAPDAAALLNRYRFVVIGADHRNPLNIVRSLGLCGIRPDVIVIGTESHLLSSCRYVRHICLVPSHAAALEKLLALYGSAEKKVFVLTGEDKMTELLNASRERLPQFFFFSVSHGPTPLFYFEKPNQNELAVECGLRIPKSVLWHRGDSIDGLEEQDFPVIAKAADSLSENWKNATAILHGKAELRAFLQTYSGDTLLIQQYIRKQNELAIQGYSSGFGKNVNFTVSTTYEYILEGDYSHYVKAAACNDQALNDSIRRMIERMGFDGIFEAEFLVDQAGNLWFLEVNLRCTALLYLSNRAGMPPAVLWALETLGYPIAEAGLPRKELPVWGISEFDDLHARVLSKKIPLSAWLRELKSCQCLCYYHPNDKKPFYAELEKMLLRKLRKRKG